MIILGIDPGTELSAAVLFDDSAKEIKGRWYLPNEEMCSLIRGVMNNGKTSTFENVVSPNPKRKVKLDVDVQRNLGHDVDNDWEYPIPDILALEMVSCYATMVGKEVFETAVWIGRFIEMSMDRCFKQQEVGALSPYTLITRSLARTTICGTARAGDPQMRAALEDKMGGGRGTKKNPGPMYGMTESDLRSALAVAMTFSILRTQYALIQRSPRWQKVLEGKVKLKPYINRLISDGGELFPHETPDREACRAELLRLSNLDAVGSIT